MRDRSHYLADGSAPARVNAETCAKIRAAHLPEVEGDAPSKIALDFGKHRDVLVRDLPTSYLKWMRDEFKPYPSQRPALAAALLELARREKLQHGERE